ncbi:hypothetical protein MJO29_002883, partial [Puccinia striiformis f. sp. tritici]
PAFPNPQQPCLPPAGQKVNLAHQLAPAPKWIPACFLPNRLGVLTQMHAIHMCLGVLLSMIHDPHGQLITHPVPTSTNMITNMRSRMLPSGSEHSQECDQLHANSRLEWQVVQGKQVVQAKLIWTKSYKKERNMGQLDATTFGDQFYSRLDVDSILPPTEAKVIAKMVLSAGEQPLHCSIPPLFPEIHPQLLITSENFEAHIVGNQCIMYSIYLVLVPYLCEHCGIPTT